MNLSSGDPQPIFSNVALGPSALGQHWKLLASAHHLIKPQCKIPTLNENNTAVLILMTMTGITLNGQNTNVVLGFCPAHLHLLRHLIGQMEKHSREMSNYAASVIKDFLMYMF